MTPDQLEALAGFARRYGSGYKQALIDKWCKGTHWLEPAGEYLDEIKTQLGGWWLFNYQLPYNHR